MKQGEIDYLKTLGETGHREAFDKPFSQATCAKNLVDLGLILSLLPPPPSRVLDLGCGSGWTSWFLASYGHRVVGQDIAPDMIALANRNRDRHAAHSASFVVSDYESLPFRDEFDAGLFFDSLHHAEDEEAAIASAFRAIRHGGVLITHEPGQGHSRSAESIDAIARYGVSEKDMPPSRIFALGKRAGFTSFERLLDPTALFRAVYGTNIESGTPEPGFGRRLKSVAGLLRRAVDRRSGAICVLRK